MYSNITKAYRASPLAHLGQSDHLSLFLTPAYKPVIKHLKPTTRTVVSWPEDASSQLQDCFQRTNWCLFSDPDIETYTTTVLCYIKTCIGSITSEKRTRVFPSRKPWMTKEVQKQLRERDAAFRVGDRERYSMARHILKRGIKQAKAAYKERIEGHFSNSDPARMWQGIQHITNYRGHQHPPPDSNTHLAEELNHFFARFVTAVNDNDIEPAMDAAAATTSTAAASPLSLQTHKVRRIFSLVNIRKTAGPDGIPGRVVRDCAHQLAEVFTDIFNLSLSQAVVPTCLKSATIIPVPKQNNITCLNDYRPVALTPIIAKCFEKLVQKHIKSSLPANFDQHQYAYRAHRSTEDAISTDLHTALTHLDQRGTYVRMLFIDYSSAFNTIVPSRLVTELLGLGFNSTLCMWIKDFLSGWPQTVRLGSHLSPTLTLSTGAPQGCVLSPILYSLYTSDCIPTYSTNTIINNY